jgi:hypothetical protein
MPAPQSDAASSDPDSSTVEEIKTTLYVDSARLKVLSQETRLHAAAEVRPAASARRGRSPPDPQ